MVGRLRTIVLLVVWIGQVTSVAPMAGAGTSGPRPALSEAEGCIAWVHVADWRALVVYQTHRLALGQRCGRRRGGRRLIRRIKRRRRRRRLPVAVWHRLKPVLEELVREERVCQTSGAVSREAKSGGLSGLHLPVQIVVVTPDYNQTLCPDCGGPTKCKRPYYIHPQDIDLEQPTILQAYRKVRKCCDPICEGRLAPELDFVAKGGRLTKQAKEKAGASVTEDGVPLERVPQRMWRDFHVRVAKSTVHEWVYAEAEADLGAAEHTQ